MGTCLLCANCCRETEMLLANEDIERIENKLPRREFSYVRDGYLYLKNQQGNCVFLEPESMRCSIYEIRPRGCRFYPIVYDPYLKKCVVDKDCSNKENIPQRLLLDTCSDIYEFILLLEDERNQRLKLKHKNKRTEK